MIARAAVTAEAGPGGGTRVTGLRSAAPLLLRVTPRGVYLVGGAAGPVGGDRLRLDIRVGAGAELILRTAAASVALRGPGGPRKDASRLEIEASVGPGGGLRWEPEPSVAAAGCRPRVTAAVALAEGARLLWREERIAGRHGEEPGSIRSLLGVDLGAQALLRHELRVGPDAPGWAGPAGAGGGRAIGTVVVEPTDG